MEQSDDLTMLALQWKGKDWLHTHLVVGDFAVTRHVLGKTLQVQGLLTVYLGKPLAELRRTTSGHRLPFSALVLATSSLRVQSYENYICTPSIFSIYSKLFLDFTLLNFCKNPRACKINCKAISESSFHPDIPDFQAFSAPWTFLRGNSDFPLTKLPLSPNETSRFPRALSAFYLHI